MPISVSALAKKLEIAPEAVMLHAMDLDFDIPEDEMLPDDIASQIQKLEIGDEITQFEHQMEDQAEREIVEKQAAKTAGQKKVPHKKKKTEVEKELEKKIEIVQEADGTIILPSHCSVRELATKIGKPIPLVLIKLKANGVVANLKQEVDYETAAIVATDLGVKVKKEAAELTSEDLFHGNLADLLKDEEVEHLEERPPVVSIMGHVDHGKTSILDYIRKASVASGEAGGITQSIGAYQVKTKDHQITFLDTPGHEAFTKMRARGARATDIAILVVAATEGLKPQSIEAIAHAKDAGIPIIVAINKMDLAGANPDLVKGQLAEHDVSPEDWGGDVPCIPVSAKTGDGIDKLLETISIVAELQSLKANPARSAIGTVIESSMDKRSGISATILINTGTLKKGDAFVIYDQNGKIRSMKDYQGKEVDVAPPSTPVQISGFSHLPQVGDLLQVMENDKVARRKAEEVASIVHETELAKEKTMSIEILRQRIAEGKLDQIKVIVKADSNGTLEAVVSELEKVKVEHAAVKVIYSGVGEISESDIMLASSGDGIVVGFNSKAPGRIGNLARQEGVQILSFDVIYHLVEKMQEILEGKLSATEAEEIIGVFTVKEVFAANRKMAVLGGEVLSGKMRKSGRIRQYRMIENEVTEKNEEGEDITKKVKERTLMGHAKIDTVQKGQDVVNEVNEGAECGMKVEHSNLVFEKGDEVELYVEKH
ncbi:MAG TPA: translation initiation factor IF-2 [Candidatus Gracilibacteria bacterium]